MLIGELLRRRAELTGERETVLETLAGARCGSGAPKVGRRG